MTNPNYTEKMFLRDFIKFIRIHRGDIISFKTPCRTNSALESLILNKRNSNDSIPLILLLHDELNRYSDVV